MNDLYKLTNSISNRAFISNNKLTNKIRLIEVQASKISRVMKVIDFAKLRDIAKLCDIRLNKEY